MMHHPWSGMVTWAWPPLARVVVGRHACRGRVGRAGSLEVQCRCRRGHLASRLACLARGTCTGMAASSAGVFSSLRRPMMSQPLLARTVDGQIKGQRQEMRARPAGASVQPQSAGPPIYPLKQSSSWPGSWSLEACFARRSRACEGGSMRADEE